MVKLSKRLELVASMVSDNSKVIDVGCDHAYLSIYLASERKNIQIIASDVNPNPLKIAKDNVKKYQMEDKIVVKLKDGINDLESDVDTVVISGIGGILMSEIINNRNNLSHVKTLILSPNNEFEIVRKTIIKLGYKVVEEKLITDNKKTYLVLKAIIGNCRHYDYYFGILNNQDIETIYYFTKILNDNTKILKRIPYNKIIKRIKLKMINKRIKKFLEK